MAQYDILKSVPLFADLPPEDLDELCHNVDEVQLSAGQRLFAEGEAGDRAYVVSSGELEVLKASAGRDVLLNVLHAGDVVGEMALLEHQPRIASVRARSDSVLLSIRQDQLDHLLNTSLSATRAMFFTVLSRWRKTEALLRQSEKMAQLGTLTAGIAHEMNNPAAAVQRGAAQLGEMLGRYGDAAMAIAKLSLTPDEWQLLENVEASRQTAARQPLDSIERSDRTAEVEDWLEAHGHETTWELAPELVEMGVTARSLTTMSEGLAPAHVAPALQWLVSTRTARSLLVEVGLGASRISEIVKALKAYSYLDQAPVQNVDIHEGIENTLVMLHGKLKYGVEVRREYAAALPKIVGYGSDLNQVWTNLIDYAVDAMKGHGTLTLRTHKEGSWVVVEVEDTGSGIPAGLQSRVFDSFFTTKPQGKGTGLGLNITSNIIVPKHRGDIKVSSKPGQTRFEVWLPVNFEASPAHS